MIKLGYNGDYLSIKKFDSLELPDFVVLTGVNGSGKTHLLEAIQKGSVLVEDIRKDQITYFDYKNFYLENEGEFTFQQLDSERESAWQYFQKHFKNQIESFKNSFKPQYDRITELCKEEKLKLLLLKKKDFSEPDSPVLDCWESYKNYKKRINDLFEVQVNYKDNPQANSIYILFKKLSYSIDEISKEEFKNIYKPFNFKNNFLPQQIGKVFWDYFLKLDDNEYKSLQNLHKGKSHKVLSEKEFVDAHGQKPWDLISKVLDAFGSLKYKITDPESLDLSRDDKFKLQLIDKENGNIIDFNALSSGEKVLMALVASIYKGSSDHYFPKLLLLDEIDASLHPSMVQNLLDVVTDVFVNNGTKVILVTHSPTTIALSAEESVYVMKTSGKKRITKKSKSEALSLLTEGYATLEEGLSLVDQIAKNDFVIITEGNNVSYIKKALEFAKIDSVEIQKGLEHKSGQDQLKVIFDFFELVNHEKKILFVLDCDVPWNREDNNNTYFFKFPMNSANSIATKRDRKFIPRGTF